MASPDRVRVVSWALAALVALLYLPALGGEVLDWDDGLWVHDPLVSDGLAVALREAFFSVHDHAWYPVLRLSWWLQGQLMGGSVVAMHAVNLALFVGAVPVLVGLLRRCGVGGRPALAAVALWAVHPSRVESLAWLSSRKDVLALAWLLGAASVLLPERGRSPRVVLGTTLALAAFLTKVAVVPLAGVLWLVVRAREGSAQATRRVGPALALGMVVGLIGVVVFERAGVPTARPYEGLGMNLVFAGWQLGSWALRLVTIWDLAAIVPLPTNPWPLAALGLGLWVSSVLWAWRRGPWAQALVGLIWLPLIPTSGVVPMSFWAADRHLIYPSFAVALALVLSLEWVSKQLTSPGAAPSFGVLWRAAQGAALVLPWLLLWPLAWGSAQRIPDWRSSISLWQADMSRPGEHWVRGLQLGTALGREGRFEEAVVAFRRSLALRPDNGKVLARRIIAELAADGSWTPADRAAAALLEPPPRAPSGWGLAAVAILRAGHLEAARDAALLAQRLGSNDPQSAQVIAAVARLTHKARATSAGVEVSP